MFPCYHVGYIDVFENVPVDLFADTCSYQHQIAAWWQVDLQGLYIVHGIEIHRFMGISNNHSVY